MTELPTAASRRPALPALGFAAALVVLAALALLMLRARPVIVTGWPDSPAGQRAFAALAHQLPLETGELRLRSVLKEEADDPDQPPAAAALATLSDAIAERPRDPRLRAAEGLVDLAGRRFDSAARHYQHALSLAPSYGEARLGLGVTLGMKAADESDGSRARGLRLRAISQFAAVPEGDPCRALAIYDRALLLERVGRKEEAWRWAEDYLRGDPGSAWSLALKQEVQEP
jgi:tetratricopeptide (TPR) repeat protein